MGGGRDPLTDLLEDFTQWPGAEECRTPDSPEEQGEVWTLVSSSTSVTADAELVVSEDTVEVDRLSGSLKYENAPEAELDQDPGVDLSDRKHLARDSLSPGFQELGTEIVVCEVPPCQPEEKHVLISADNGGGDHCVAADVLLQGETVFPNDAVSSRLRPEPECFGGLKSRGFYKLMNIKTDKIDTSLVEKMLVSAEQIVALCQEITADSASFEDASAAIDFESLNQHSVHVVGLYGSKKVLADIFERLKLVDDIMLRGMECDNLETGLYGILRGSMLYVFYWHQGLHLQEGSRHSCNFIRYVADLCETVYICLDDKALNAACLFSGEGMKVKRKQRTQRLQVAMVKDSENALSLHAGFEVHPEILATPSNCPEIGGANGLRQPRLKLCEGRDRAALLYPVFHPSQRTQKSTEIMMKTHNLPEMVEGWLSTYNLDLSQLSEQSLSVFLQHAALPESKAYCDLLKRASSRIQADQYLLAELSKRVQDEQRPMEKVLNECVQAYRQVYHSEDESILRNSGTVVGDKNAEPNCEGSVPPSTALEEGGVKLCKLWVGDNKKHDDVSLPSLIYSGSEVTVEAANADFPFPIKVGDVFLVMGLESRQGETPNKAFGPIVLGQDLILRLKGEPTGHTVILHALDGECSAGPVVASQALRCEVRGSQNRNWPIMQLKLVSQSEALSGMAKWIKSFINGTVPKLRETTEKLSFLILNPRDAKISEFVLKGAKEVIAASDPVSLFDFYFSDERVAELLAKSMYDASAKESPVQSSEARQACEVAYKRVWSDVATRLSRAMKKYIVPSLRNRVQFQMKQAGSLLRQSLKQEESKYLEVVEKLRSIKGESSLTLTLTGCSLKQAKKKGLGNLSVEYSYDVNHPEQITWNVVELSPMKKDLDNLAVQEDVIVPKCSPLTALIKLDASERVLLVVLTKSREVIVVVQDEQQSSGRVYVIQKLGMKAQDLQPVKEFRKGCDLAAYDECLEYLALYDRSSSKISIYRFRDKFRRLTFLDSDLLLAEHSGSKNLTSIMFIPEKLALVLIDDELRVRVFEFAGAPMLRPRAISLSGPFGTAKVSRDGSCLLIFHVPSGENETDEEVRGGLLAVDVYLLDDTMARLKSIQLDHSVVDVSNIDAAIVGFGAQVHLVLLDTSDPAKGVHSHIMKLSLASEVRRLQKVAKSRAPNSTDMEQKAHTTCAPLDYLFRIFDKYATSPPLAEKVRDFRLHVVLGGRDSDDKKAGLQEKCEQYVKSLLKKLETEEGKSFSKLACSVTSDILTEHVFKDNLRGSLHSRNQVLMGDWIRQLVCLVPIQIARAENNTLTPLVDGLEMSANHEYSDAVSLSSSLRFGLYDAVLENWRQPVKVISSMGKQSSGKSYLLNHLSGSVLDVAGGRCTDGVWMTMRPSQGFLYVLLDFEGLGSFERSDQEDVLLSVLNAAVSNITIFNKKDFNLDKDTEAVFERFQNAVSLVKQDSRLFKGLFYIAIKDVVSSDVDELKDEFIRKIERQCERSEESFLTKMYGGDMVVAAMPPIQRKEYHESVKEIAEVVEDLDTYFPSGRQFAADLKLMTAQISTRDWSGADSKRVTLKIDLLRKHLHTAINWGSLLKDAPLTNFDTDELVPDTPLEAAFNTPDTGLQLFHDQLQDNNNVADNQAAAGDGGSGSIIQFLREVYESCIPRSGDDDESWHWGLEHFLLSLADRRRTRVLKWVECNTEEFAQDGDAQNLRLEATSILAELKQSLSLCSCKCKSCFLCCVLQKGHAAGDHDCTGGHVCTQSCTYCIEEGRNEEFQNECSLPSGHEGSHDCKVRTHCCGKQCRFKDQSPNCAHMCSLKPGHKGEHRCSTSSHFCGATCSLPACGNHCAVTLDVEHEHHRCHEKMCPVNCCMEGCRRTCASGDHFHALASDKHLCDEEHRCGELCACEGLCDVHTEVVNKQWFNGKRASFEIEHVSKQSGVKKACCLPIPAGLEQHEGPHRHSTNPEAAHTCEARCRACGYYCRLPVDHRGKHETAHGNMTSARFVSEQEDIDIADRKYAWGESGMAEMCMLHCKAQGRGHVHLAPCVPDALGACGRLYRGAQHQRRPYGPDFHTPKDELTHAMYWEEMGFKDPCADEDRAQFELCNHSCKSKDHDRPAQSQSQASSSSSYCTQPLWHPAVAKGDAGARGDVVGYVTDDGHVFSCRHSHGCTQHVVFVIDKSKSMSQDDIFPSLDKFCTNNRNRLGAVFEAVTRFLQVRQANGEQDIVSIVLFNDEAQVVVERQPNRPATLADCLLRHYPKYGTNYSSGLEKAAAVIARAEAEANIESVIIFFSDGRNANGNYPVEVIRSMKEMHPQLVVHTLLFGHRTDTLTLDMMAREGGGTFKRSLDEVQLARSFEQLAYSLRPQVASLFFK